MALLGSCLFIAGCKEANPGGKPTRTADSADRSDTKVSAPTDEVANAVDVRIASWDETQKLVAAESGKVVIIDVWSLNCQPCIREFPGLVKLSEKYPDKVACISFDIDHDGSKDNPPESYRADVLKFLKERNAHFKNVIASDVNEDFLNAIKLGGPPAVFVYGRDGKLVRRFDNSVPKQPEFTYEKDVIPLVDQLLAGP
ncbi:MAG: TlpA family protein disulfide reductase [Planctomycetaceae bacterium]